MRVPGGWLLRVICEALEERGDYGGPIEAACAVTCPFLPDEGWTWEILPPP